MENEVLDKWLWIAEKCKELEYFSTANVAEFMATTEQLIYPGKMSWYWRTHFRSINTIYEMSTAKASVLVAVAEMSEFKVGCVLHFNQCTDCELGKKYGKCRKSGSIERFWKYVLEKDYGKELNEENIKELAREFKVHFGQ